MIYGADKLIARGCGMRGCDQPAHYLFLCAKTPQEFANNLPEYAYCEEHAHHEYVCAAASWDGWIMVRPLVPYQDRVSPEVKAIMAEFERSTENVCAIRGRT